MSVADDSGAISHEWPGRDVHHGSSWAKPVGWLDEWKDERIGAMFVPDVTVNYGGNNL
jgi:hypothetical protein